MIQRGDCARRFYTIFEPRIDQRQRPAIATWTLLDYIADALQQVPERVRLVFVSFVVTKPIPSFTTPQLVLAALSLDTCRLTAGQRVTPHS